MRKKKFIPPIVLQETTLELESAILGTSQEFGSKIEATGHEVEAYTTSSYWEDR